MIRVLHVSDIHLGSGLSHGRINPTTGINTRLEDFAHTLSLCIDHALGLVPEHPPVDLVLFGGDAFPDATPPPLHQDLFARQFRRLADAGIPTVLLVGNHDQQGQGQDGSTLAIYRTLGVSGFVVGDQLATHRIETQAGPIQVTTLPWLNRSALLTQEEMAQLSGEQVSAQLLRRLQLALEGEIRRLDPELPAILLVHAMVDTAKFGSERHLAVGRGFTVPLSLLARSEYQYVALGHVHRHQVLCQDPPVIYPGSLERVDFGEEEETKGFIIAALDRERATYEFIPLPVRAFRTLRVDITDLPPEQTRAAQAQILKTITQSSIENAIVRLIYQARKDQRRELDEAEIHRALAPAFSYLIAPETISPERTRLPQLQTVQSDPLQALEQYLDSRPDLAAWREDMVQVTQQLLMEDERWQEDRELELDLEIESEQVEQLKLL